MLLATTVYLFINVAYFSVVSKADILGSRRIIAALFFRNLFGPAAEKALSVFIALSTLGNLLSSQFSQGRIVQELGREGVLPFSPIFASDKPFNAPLAGLLPNTSASTNVHLVQSYSLALVNTLVSLGLLLLYTPLYRVWNWNPPYQAPKIIIVSFFLSNLFLVSVPLIPPAPGSRVYDHLPYWLHVLVALSISLIGAGYWYLRCVWLPRRRGYKLEREWVLQDDGVSRYIFRPTVIAS
ncbi:amino acid permease-domain-containing protein [Infundibulicybe gibba]|nr:amino acid permease-domain-containing protein [Infundibulicybe gibba]